jgi:SAM-dependent methyltransferase
VTASAEQPSGSDAKAHPAKFSGEVMAWLRLAGHRWLPPGPRILDPFAGVGTVHALGWQAVALELEPEWARQSPGPAVVGNALALPFPDCTFDGIITSPCYGNRMADHHNARDDSKRHTYRHCLGRPLHVANAGAMQWSRDYQLFHEAAWAEAVRVLRYGGYFLLNVSDHIRAYQRQPVTWWHLSCLQALGLELMEVTPIYTKRQRHGANANLRVDHESLCVLRK